MLRLLYVSEEGHAVEMDLFLRQCLREFPFLQCAILKQLVATLAKVKPVSACNTVLVKVAS